MVLLTEMQSKPDTFTKNLYYGIPDAHILTSIHIGFSEIDSFKVNTHKERPHSIRTPKV